MLRQIWHWILCWRFSSCVQHLWLQGPRHPPRIRALLFAPPATCHILRESCFLHSFIFSVLHDDTLGLKHTVTAHTRTCARWKTDGDNVKWMEMVFRSFISAMSQPNISNTTALLAVDAQCQHIKSFHCHLTTCMCVHASDNQSCCTQLNMNNTIRMSVGNHWHVVSVFH